MKPACLAALALLLPAGTAQAAAYYFTDAGTRALGRGSAFVAGADDLSSQYWNPAGLARMDRAQAYISGSLVGQYVYFDRADEPDNDLTFDPVENQSPPMKIPALGFATKFGLPDWTFAVGLYSPYAPDLEYPSDGPQRYILNDMLIWEFANGVSVAHTFTDWAPWLTLGVGLSAWTLRVEQALALTVGLADEPVQNENPANDIDVAISVWDTFTPSWNAGLLADPTDWLTVGLSVQPPVAYHAKGSISADFTDNVFSDFIDGTTFTDEDATMLLTVPLVLRGGVAWHPNDRFEWEVAGVYEGWHILDMVTITDIDLVIKAKEGGMLPSDAVVTNDILLPTYYHDAWSVRTGVEYDLNPHLTGRAGAYYEAPGIPDSTEGVSFVDGQKVGLGLGAGVHMGDFTVDLGGAYTQLFSREITETQLQQLFLKVDLADPSQSAVLNGKYVGLGTFKSHLTFMSAALTWKFGPGPG